MNIWLQVKENEIINLVQQDNTPPDLMDGSYWVLKPENRPYIDIGWLHENNAFKRNTKFPWYYVSAQALLNRFTQQELQAISNAENSDPEIKELLDKIKSSNKIGLSDPTVILLLTNLLRKDLITQDRFNLIIMTPALPNEAVELDSILLDNP